MMVCRRCETPWNGHGQPEFREICSHCYADLHCCLNCRFYDEFAHNKCRSLTAEWVADKEKRNFCPEFEFQDRVEVQHSPKFDDAREKVKAQWEALWKRGD